MPKKVLMVDAPEFRDFVRTIEEDFAAHGLRADFSPVTHYAFATSGLRVGIYGLLFLEPFGFSPSDQFGLYDMIDAARDIGVPVCVFTNLSDADHVDRRYGLRKGADYKYFLRKPADAGDINFVVADVFGISSSLIPAAERLEHPNYKF